MSSTSDGESLDWDAHRDKILQRFISEGKAWREVAAEMKNEHNFVATYVPSMFLFVFYFSLSLSLSLLA